MQQFREKYLLSELFSIFDYLFRHYSLLDSNILFRKVRVSDQSSLQSYLRSGDSLLPEQDIISCLAYLQQVPKLKKFAQWIYDAAPQIFTNDLILATYIIVCSYYRQRLIHNSHDWIVSHILLELGAISNRSFQVLKISTEPCLYVGYVLKGEPCVLIFYRKLVETVIDLVQNQEGSEKKSKTRKKID